MEEGSERSLKLAFLRHGRGRVLAFQGSQSRVRTSLCRLRDLFTSGPVRRAPWGPLLEVALVILWALWIGRPFLDFNPRVWPNGGEYGMVVAYMYPWTLLSKCGDCALWNGFTNGGAPAIAELQAPVLHPLGVITTVLWGPVNGSKALILAALAMAGLAQWWLARVLKLGVVARLWSAALAVAGGHMSGRLDAGLYPILLSISASSLVIAPGLQLALTGTRRAAAVFGVMLASALTSSQGYLQLALVFGLLPAFLPFLLKIETRRLKPTPLWNKYLMAGVLAMLLSAAWLVPMLHFWPNFVKHIDPRFGSTQFLEYAPLNLVIRDPAFFRTLVLRKQPYPFLYTDYIGWVPVVLAVFGFRLAPRDSHRTLAFFLAAIVLIYLASTAVTLNVLMKLAPTFIAGVRNPAMMSGLAVPLILGLAAWGLDGLSKRPWSALRIGLFGPLDGASKAPTGEERLYVRLQPFWMVLAIPLLWSLQSAIEFGTHWMRTQATPPGYYTLMRAMRTGTSQWVAAPFGEHHWDLIGIEEGLKLTNVSRPWVWRGRELPQPYIEATRSASDRSAPNLLQVVEQVNLLGHASDEYAFVESNLSRVPCQASAQGGHIDVDCQTELEGTLTVRENSWSGWTVWRDGQRVALGPGPWLTVAAPQGRHKYEFRYRPWDVPVGLGLTCVGIGLAAWLWFGASKASPRSVEHKVAEERQSVHS